MFFNDILIRNFYSGVPVTSFPFLMGSFRSTIIRSFYLINIDNMVMMYHLRLAVKTSKLKIIENRQKQPYIFRIQTTYMFVRYRCFCRKNYSGPYSLLRRAFLCPKQTCNGRCHHYVTRMLQRSRKTLFYCFYIFNELAVTMASLNVTSWLKLNVYE